MTSLSESQAFLDQFDRCMPLCERGDAVTVINALHTLNSITQASIAQAVELREGKDFVCSFLLELELALELYISPSRKLGTIDGGLPSLYSFNDDEVSALANVPSPLTKAKVLKFLEALGVAPSPEFHSRSVADTVVDFLRCQVKPTHVKPAAKHAPSKRNISWADQCSSGSGSDSDSDCSLPPLEDDEEGEASGSLSLEPASLSSSFSHDSSIDEEEEDEEEPQEEEDDLIDAAATLFLAPAPMNAHCDSLDNCYEPTRTPSTRNCNGMKVASTFKSHDPLYKTRLCKNFKSGTCTYGDQCNFAHGECDLRSADAAMLAFTSAVAPVGRPGLRCGDCKSEGGRSEQGYRVKMCKNYEKDGYCKFGDRCAFAHSREQLRKSEGPRK